MDQRQVEAWRCAEVDYLSGFLVEGLVVEQEISEAARCLRMLRSHLLLITMNLDVPNRLGRLLGHQVRWRG